jgi:outer membrane protein OmpA-like peptidoglycan-associated protein
VLLTWLTVVTRSVAIETDLAERVRHGLATYAINGVTIALDGRDVQLSGEIPRELDPKYVAEIAGEIWGVRSVSIDGLRRQASSREPGDPLNPRFETARIARLGGDLSNPLSAEACQRMMVRIAASGTVRFELDGATPMLESYPVLNDLAAVAYQCPDTRLVIGGHIDTGDAREARLRLSRARVEAVERFFNLAGIPAERMRVVAYGDSQPVASNSSPEGRAANRRITFDVQPLD